jgi:hypothetical protein
MFNQACGLGKKAPLATRQAFLGGNQPGALWLALATGLYGPAVISARAATLRPAARLASLMPVRRADNFPRTRSSLSLPVVDDDAEDDEDGDDEDDDAEEAEEGDDEPEDDDDPDELDNERRRRWDLFRGLFLEVRLTS